MLKGKHKLTNSQRQTCHLSQETGRHEITCVKYSARGGKFAGTGRIL